MPVITLKRVAGQFGFDAADELGHIIPIDASPEMGGENYGARPMQLLLMGLGGCSGIDILNILRKQKQEVLGFNMRIEGEREPGKEPSIWASVKLVFEITGHIDQSKAQRAVDLSMDKYCSVAETLRRAGGSLSWEVVVITPEA
jgi:putative redox protein